MGTWDNARHELAQVPTHDLTAVIIAAMWYLEVKPDWNNDLLSQWMLSAWIERRPRDPAPAFGRIVNLVIQTFPFHTFEKEVDMDSNGGYTLAKKNFVEDHLLPTLHQELTSRLM